jgi:glutathione peroxidase
MQELLNKYGEKGLKILIFPCNQFFGQEPKPNAEIKKMIMDKYPAHWLLFEKSDVNGKGANEVYRWLRTNSSLNSKGKCQPIGWNFAKFLLDCKGQVVQYYSPGENPLSFEKEIKKTLDI